MNYWAIYVTVTNDISMLTDKLGFRRSTLNYRIGGQATYS